MAEGTVVTSREGAVGVIELARPEKFNAINRATFTAMVAAMEAFEAEGSGIRAVLIRAQGRNFCTGGDLVEAQSMEGDSAALAEYLAFMNGALTRLEASPLPVVCACQGLVLAGGLEIALACDVVFAADTARFGDQHVHYGLIPGWGATQRLVHQAGLRRALDLMFSGRWLDAQTAETWGIVNHVVPAGDLAGAAMAYCATLASRSRPGLAAMKALARAAGDLPLDEGLRLEAARTVQVMEGPDPAEGIRAFLERRRPQFGG